ASSFCWALLPTLVALAVAARQGGRAGPGPSARGLGAIAACCLLAPMGSAVGLFAGPAAAARLWPGSGTGWARAACRAAVPLAGTAAYLAMAGLVGHDAVGAESVRANRDL